MSCNKCPFPLHLSWGAGKQCLGMAGLLLTWRKRAWGLPQPLTGYGQSRWRDCWAAERWFILQSLLSLLFLSYVVFSQILQTLQRAPQICKEGLVSCSEPPSCTLISSGGSPQLFRFLPLSPLPCVNLISSSPVDVGQSHGKHETERQRGFLMLLCSSASSHFLCCRTCLTLAFWSSWIFIPY